MIPRINNPNIFINKVGILQLYIQKAFTKETFKINEVIKISKSVI